MQARIRYLALTARDPQALAHYYALHFGMWLLGESEAGDISMTDGFYNLTLFKQRAELGDEDAQLGTNHFGIEVDNMAEVEDRLARFAPDLELWPERGDLFTGEFRTRDPNGLIVSLSTQHFHVPHEYFQVPSIHHVALSVPNNDAVLDFYSNVFGFRATSATEGYRNSGRTTRMAGDGATALAILPEPALLDEPPDGHRKFGFNHFGFVVADMDAMRRRLPIGTVTKRPSSRPFAEYRVVDPEGNNFDISATHGFEVDHGVWINASNAA
jgi:catechol 2,3-dioxygenase-like lactoylglutathione lyase family enzyme